MTTLNSNENYKPCKSVLFYEENGCSIERFLCSILTFKLQSLYKINFSKN